MKERKFHMPTAYTILFLLLILVAAATWIIPAGSYDYVDGVPVAGTYHAVAQNPQGVGDVLKAIGLCIIEVSFLRLIMAWVRATALLGYKKRKHSWGRIERKKIQFK